MIDQYPQRVANNTRTTTELFTGEFNTTLELQSHGNKLVFPTTLKWSWLGDSNKPVVVVLGGISANRYVAYGHNPQQTRFKGNPALRGWWEDFVGHRNAIDVEKYSVLSFDYPGGNSRLSQQSQFQSPVINNSATQTIVAPLATSLGSLPITTYDQADALNRILERLEIKKVAAIIGSSYGGMVSLAFSERYPDKIYRQLVISAASESHQRSKAFRSIQREIVKLCHQYNDVDSGLALARQLGMITYRSIDEFEQRFSDNQPQKVTDYLKFHGEKFARNFDPGSFLTLSESIDNHVINASSISTETTLVSVDSDELVFQSQIEKLAQTLSGKTTHYPIQSIYGHDAFLKEVTQLSNIIQTFLETTDE